MSEPVIIGGAITLVVSAIFYYLASRGLKRAVKKINLLLDALHVLGLVDYLYDKKGNPISIKLNIPRKNEIPHHNGISTGEATNVKVNPPEDKRT